MKKFPWKPYVFWILFTEAVGALSGWLTRDGAKHYGEAIVQPPLSPPAIVFPIVWGILFALMGIGAARIYLSPPIRCPLPKPAALFGTAGLQLLLEPSVLQPAALWPSLCLADGAVGADSLDDPVFPQDRFSGRMAPGTLLSVGYLRRLSELRRVAAEPITRKPASARKSQEALLKASWLLQYGVPERIRTSGLPLRSTAYHFVICSYHIFPCCFFANCAAWRQVNLHKFP